MGVGRSCQWEGGRHSSAQSVVRHLPCEWCSLWGMLFGWGYFVLCFLMATGRRPTGSGRGGCGGGYGCAILKEEGFQDRRRPSPGAPQETDPWPCSHHPKGTGWTSELCSSILSLWGEGRQGRPHASPFTQAHSRSPLHAPFIPALPEGLVPVFAQALPW